MDTAVQTDTVSRMSTIRGSTKVRAPLDGGLAKEDYRTLCRGTSYAADGVKQHTGTRSAPIHPLKRPLASVAGPRLAVESLRRAPRLITLSPFGCVLMGAAPICGTTCYVSPSAGAAMAGS